MAKSLTRIPTMASAVTAVVVTAYFEWLVGRNHHGQDLACFVAAAAVVLHRGLLARRNAPAARKSPGSSIADVVLWIGASWVLISATDLWLRSGSAIRPFEPGLAHRPVTNPAFALSLSGGGYRAALFHAGLLSEMEKAGYRPAAISSVSGGSIISAFYTVGGSPSEFLTAVQNHGFNLKRSFAEIQNAIPLFLSPRFTRTDLQAAALDRMFLAGIRHREMARKDVPELMLCTTDIATGDMIGITPEGIVTQAVTESAARSAFLNPALVGTGTVLPPWFDESEHAHLPGEERTSKLVATSGAFPGAFRPFEFDSVWQISNTRKDHRLYLLADGGIGDNLGLVLTYAANHLAQFSAKAKRQLGGGGAELAARSWHLDRWLIDTVIVSDASAVPIRNPPASMLSELASTIDTVYLATGGDQMAGKIDPAIQRPPALLITPQTLLRGPVTKEALAEGSRQSLASLWLGTELVLARDQNGIPTSPTFTTISPDNVDFLVQHMPISDKERALAAMSELETNGVRRNGVWHQPTFRTGTPEYVLYRLVLHELDRRLKAFIVMSTLDDQPYDESAASIFLLGQYMFRLNQPYINRRLRSR